MDVSPPADAKARLRAELRRRRRELNAAELRRAAARIAEALATALPAGSGTVCAYVPVGAEPGGELPDLLRRSGRRVLLPLLRPDWELDWAEFEGRLRPGAQGIPEPAGPRVPAEELVEIEVEAVIVPALAVDARGRRLGQGGGCYDRTLARLPASTRTLALLHDGEWPLEVPVQPHDRAVAEVALPGAGHVRLAARPA